MKEGRHSDSAYLGERGMVGEGGRVVASQAGEADGFTGLRGCGAPEGESRRLAVPPRGRPGECEAAAAPPVLHHV